MLIVTDAVVLKQSKFGEGDLMLTLFAKKLGKVQAVAKGARKPRGKYTVGTQVFSYGDYILFKGRELYQISQVDMKQSFYELREDMVKLSYGAYILELTESIIIEEQTNNRIFDTLIQSLELLTKKKKGFETLIKAYELKVLYYSGYKPELHQCVSCGAKIEQENKFSATLGGVLCKGCYREDPFAMRVMPVTLNVMGYLINNDLEQINKLQINAEVLEELNKILRHYISTHLDRHKFKSLEILDTIVESKY